MATQVTMLTLVIVLALIYYFWPLIFERLKTRKVVVKYSSLKGEEKEQVLYLRHEDPLWDVVNAAKRKKL